MGERRKSTAGTNTKTIEPTTAWGRVGRWGAEGNKLLLEAGSHWEDYVWYLLEIRHNPLQWS